MALSEDKIRLYIRRLLLSRMRIMCTHGFYGLLLMHMRFAVDEEVETAQTDGEKITFGTAFLEELSDSELDFVMLHEIMHVVLLHCLRDGERDHEAFNIACDIVVNSNILLDNGMDLKSITLKKYGESMHLAPNGSEGYEYTAEQVYEMLKKKQSEKDKNGKKGGSGKGKSGNGKGSASSSKSNDNGKSSPSESADDEAQGNKAHSGKENADGNASGDKKEIWDDHTKWGTATENAEILRDIWLNRINNAAASIEIRDPGNERGTLPLLIARILGELKRSKINWRTVLSEFIQEEIVDYSFSPPDRRFDETPFFLPDFNETEETVKNILFMIDTSASMTNEMITTAYSEVKGAIDQFGGKLCGWLGFFDGTVAEPKPFENEEEFKIIHPKGGGGTNFHIIFDYVEQEMQNEPPVSIIILTDGYAPFPPEAMANGIPVLWLINNEKVEPPWGKIARIN